MSQKPLVYIRDLCKHYQRGEERLPVLSHLNLDVEQGAFLALMGPSGSGKSTLLNLMAGLDRPDSGILEIDGIAIGDLSERQLTAWRGAHIGFIFQFYNLLPVLNAAENIELPLLLTSLSRKARQRQVDLVLDLVGLSDRSTHLPDQLSGGQQQRVAIARALVTDPTLIVADEPTGDLDRRSASTILQLLQQLNQALKTTIVMVTHDQLAADHASITLHLDKGELALSGQ